MVTGNRSNRVTGDFLYRINIFFEIVFEYFTKKPSRVRKTMVTLVTISENAVKAL